MSRPIASALTLLALIPCAAAWVLAGAVPHAEGRYELEPGLAVERWQAPPTPAVKSPPVITVVRVDPARFGFELLTAVQHGGSRPATQWSRDFDLVGVINAGMFMPNERSAGLMIDGDHVNNGYDNPVYGGFLCFGPRQGDLAPVAVYGRTCDGFDLAQLRQKYRVVVQGYRLMGCAGEPMTWSETKLYATAAVGIDRQGWVVLIHTGTAYPMNDLTRWLARPALGLASAMFVEGGTHASLVIDQEQGQVREAGSRSVRSSNGNEFRSVPNVIGFRRAKTVR